MRNSRGLRMLARIARIPGPDPVRKRDLAQRTRFGGRRLFLGSGFIGAVCPVVLRQEREPGCECHSLVPIDERMIHRNVKGPGCRQRSDVAVKHPAVELLLRHENRRFQQCPGAKRGLTDKILNSNPMQDKDFVQTPEARS